MLYPSLVSPVSLKMDENLLGMHVLVIDDEEANVALLQYTLAAAGFTRVRSTTDPALVLPLCEERLPDLILLDLMMPEISGFAVMERLRATIPKARLPPILVLTADVTMETRYRALQEGAADFLVKPFDQMEVLLRMRHLLVIQSQHQQLTRQNDFLASRVQERTDELRQTFDRLEAMVSQLQTTRTQMIQQERLSTLGAMAAGLAHDFNNALSLILGYGELLVEDIGAEPAPSTAPEFLHTIIAAAQDAAGMFERLRVFYRPISGAQPLKSVDVNKAVARAVALTRPRWHGQALGDAVTITVEEDLCPNLPLLLSDEAELCEMLTNLIFNAVDAMPSGGRILLQTSLRTESQSSGIDSPESQATEIVIEIADTGLGMSDEVRRRCLEPFFTTKGNSGTGLGLAMVCATVRRYGGVIEVESAEGGGTRFSVRLPVRRSGEPGATAAIPLTNRVPWRILAVDDQATFLTLIKRYLTNDRHDVTTASNYEEALAKFHANTYDLAILDRAMPGMTGDALALQIKVAAPATRVILLTGLHKIEPDCEPRPPAVDLVLSKPISRKMLRAAVAQVMACRIGVSSSLTPAPGS